MSEQTVTPAGNTDVFGVVKVMVADQINKANAIAEEVRDSRVNVGKVVHEIRTDPETEIEWVKEFQEWLAKANAAIEAKTKAIDERIKAEKVKASEMSDEVYEAKKAEYATLKKGATDAQKLAANLPGYDPAVFADLPALLTLSGGTSGAATGTKRPRLSNLTVNGEEVFVLKDVKDSDEKVKSYTFTAAAAHISKDSGVKVQPSDLSAAAFAAAGTDDLSTVNDVEFNYSANGKEYSITAVPAQGE